LDGFGEIAQFSSPFSLSISTGGRLIVGDAGSSTLRTITPLQTLLQAAVGLTGTLDLPAPLPVTSLPPSGPYYFRAIAANGGGTTVGDIIAMNIVNPISGYAAWRVAKFGADAGNPLIAGSSAIPAGDGVSNLLKYAFGLEPLVPVTGGMPVMGLSGGSLSLTYTRVTAAADVIYSVEWSSDLNLWSPTGVNEIRLSQGPLTEQYLASVSTAPATAKFLRVRVNLQ
jgi:hypothetical protein